ASFAGFAPAYDPVISIAVIIDSAAGLHEGGQIAAPVFKAIAQQTLAYLSVPQDVTADNPKRRLLLAAAKASDTDISEGSIDPLPESMDMAAIEPPAPATTAKPSPAIARLVEAKMSRV